MQIKLNIAYTDGRADVNYGSVIIIDSLEFRMYNKDNTISNGGQKDEEDAEDTRKDDTGDNMPDTCISAWNVHISQSNAEKGKNAHL